MNRKIWVVVSCFLILLVLSSCQVKSMSGADIVTSIINADDTSTSYYLETRFEDLEMEPFIMKEWRLSDGRFRIETYEQGVLQYVVVHTKEEHVTVDYMEEQVIMLDSGDMTAFASQSPRDSMIQMLEGMYDYYDIEVVEEESLLDRDVFVLELTSKKGTKDSMKIWVDKENWIMLKTESEFGDEWMAQEPVQFELNPIVDEDLFVVHGHEQFETVEMEDLINTSSLSLEESYEKMGEIFLIPNGDVTFLEAISYPRPNDEVELDLSYANHDGLRAFSYSVLKYEEQLEGIFGNEEKVIIRGNDGLLLWNETSKIIQWQDEGLQYAFFVESSMTKEEALGLIEEMVPYEP